ncbi:stromal membrane-associated protein 1 [Polymixia lowei]
MTTRSEREKAQKLNEQHQAILSKMLREDDNKYCADCEAKGPRWASWNLGVFICIRCAGIHRNLGVHISRVKSVNLDQWTPEQIQSMVDMGNTQARQLYEAHLPDTFRRPQTDQAVEIFIRDKYERKKYYDKEALVTAPNEREKKREEKKREKDVDKVERPNNSKKRADLQSDSRASPKKSTEPAVDLLGLGTPKMCPRRPAYNTDQPPDMKGLYPSFRVASFVRCGQSSEDMRTGSGQGAPQADPPPATAASTTPNTTKAEEKKPLSKDSILSLYATSSVGTQPQSQQAPAPGPGMYMAQPQMQFAPQGFAPGMGGAAPPTTMMGGGAMMPGMAMPNGGYMGMQQGMMPAGQGQNMYAMQQQQQQGQWNINQMTQQMSGMAMGSGGAAPGAFNQSAVPMTGWSAPPASGQTLSTQLWK